MTFLRSWPQMSWKLFSFVIVATSTFVSLSFSYITCLRIVTDDLVNLVAVYGLLYYKMRPTLL